MKQKMLNKGFTLIELLIVIAVIAILAGILFVALNPLKRFQDARNAQRWTDVSAILSAIKVDQVDNGGKYLDTIDSLLPDKVHQIGTEPDASASCNDPACGAEATCVDLSGLATEGYLATVPQDSSTGDVAKTRYSLVKKANGSITISACDPEGVDPIPPISVSR